jgi:predicted CopG family antitoxin
MSGIKCISVTSTTEKIFDELKKLKPDDTSFSLMLAMVCREYVEGKTKKSLKLDDFDSGFPDVFAEIDTWKSLIENMPVEDFKKLQRRHTQLGNIINKRVLKCL